MIEKLHKHQFKTLQQMLDVRELADSSLLPPISDTMNYQGYCCCCEQPAEFDLIFWEELQHNLFALYKERVIHKQCGMVSRARVVMSLLRENSFPGCVIHLQEQLTASYQWAKKNLIDCEIIGSEFDHIPGVRYENVQELSFDSNSIDIIASQDVFEHVENPLQGFNECFRVLKPGGKMFMTIPFPEIPRELNVHRVQEGLPNVYHGVQNIGKQHLVYTDFGWEIMSQLAAIGFDASIRIYQGTEYGHPGPIMVFELLKP